MKKGKKEIGLFYQFIERFDDYDAIFIWTVRNQFRPISPNEYTVLVEKLIIKGRHDKRQGENNIHSLYFDIILHAPVIN